VAAPWPYHSYYLRSIRHRFSCNIVCMVSVAASVADAKRSAVGPTAAFAATERPSPVSILSHLSQMRQVFLVRFPRLHYSATGDCSIQSITPNPGSIPRASCSSKRKPVHAQCKVNMPSAMLSNPGQISSTARALVQAAPREQKLIRSADRRNALIPGINIHLSGLGHKLHALELPSVRVALPIRIQPGQLPPWGPWQAQRRYLHAYIHMTPLRGSYPMYTSTARHHPRI
jgi:hypothetical protein